MLGTGGLLLGGLFGTIRTRTPILFSLAYGCQCFALGSTFWVARSSILTQYTQHGNISVHDRQNASGLAGAITGGLIGGIIRGRSNIIPGTLVLGLFAYAGDRLYQPFYIRSQQRRAKPALESGNAKSTWDSLVTSKWSPMKSISDEEYLDRLQEQLLRVDAEIAILDEDIEALRAEEKNAPAAIVDAAKRNGGDT